MGLCSLIQQYERLPICHWVAALHYGSQDYGSQDYGSQDYGSQIVALRLWILAHCAPYPNPNRHYLDD